MASRYVVVPILLVISGCAHHFEPASVSEALRSPPDRLTLIHEIIVPKTDGVPATCTGGLPLSPSDLIDVGRWTCVDLDPSGQLMAIGRNVWRLSDNGKALTISHPHVRAPMWFTPDGQYLFAGGTERMGKFGAPRYGTGFAVWDSRDGALVRDGSFSRFVSYYLFSPNTSTMAIARGLALFPVRFPTLEAVGSRGLDARDYAMAVYSPGGEYIATQSAKDANIKIWRTSDAGLVAALDAGKRNVKNMVFNKDGSRLAAVTLEGIVVWRVHDQTRVKTFGENMGGFKYTGMFTRRLAFSADGSFIFASNHFIGSNADSVQAWRVEDGTLVANHFERFDGSSFGEYPAAPFYRPWDAVFHPKLGVVLLKYENITRDNGVITGLRISIFRMEELTRLYLGSK